MGKQICIIGLGGFAREVMCLLTDLGRKEDIVGFLETDEIWEKKWKGKELMGKPVLPESIFDSKKYSAVIGIGDSVVRQKVTMQLPSDTIFETLIHPNAIISQWVQLGKGVVICAGSILTCNIEIGNHAQLNLHTTVGHDCVIGDFFTTAPGTKISGDCKIGKNVYFGTLAGVRQGIKICDNVTVGMGAMVVKNIEIPGIYVGMPAKKIK